MTTEEKSLETKLVEMLIDINGREASLVHWIIQRKPETALAMYEIWLRTQEDNTSTTPEYERDPEVLEEVIKTNYETGMGKIPLIKMYRQMTGQGLREAKLAVEAILDSVEPKVAPAPPF